MKPIRLPPYLRDMLVHEFESHNARVRAGEAKFDWSDVRGFDRNAIAKLLQGLDLSEHAEGLGLGTVPPGLEEKLLAALKPARRQRRKARPDSGHHGNQPELFEGSPASRPAAPTSPEPPKDVAAAPEQRPPPALQVAAPAEIRAELEAAVVGFLRGPALGAEEELAVTHRGVRGRYILGVLAPRGVALRPETDDQGAEERGEAGEEGSDDGAGAAAERWLPSSFGLTFTVDGEERTLALGISWGRYERTTSAALLDPESGEPLSVCKRQPFAARSGPIQLTEGDLDIWRPDPERPEVFVRGRARNVADVWVVTLFLVNGQGEPEKNKDAAWIFQARLWAEGAAGRPVFRPRRAAGRNLARLDPETIAEEQAMAMIYRRQPEFAVGHGCAVHVDVDPADPVRALRVATESVPVHEVPAVTSVRQDEDADLEGLVLDMKVLGEAEPARLKDLLTPLTRAYAAWIAGEAHRIADPREGLEPHRQAATDAIGRCERALGRIQEGVKVLAEDAQAAEAFRIANRVMALQRTRSLFAEAVRRGASADPQAFDQPANRFWHPFQLAFLLLNLPSATDLHHPDRSHPTEAVADLLWFPTGGGKTEAYLGLAAYTMALRRLRGPLGGRSGDAGVAVLMRYTLRLLTIQQFQRAAALLCALESIRRTEPRLGAEPFRLGLWVGKRATPNTTEQSHEAIHAAHGHRQPSVIGGSGTPAQLLNCPWCGRNLDPGRHWRVERSPQGSARTLVFCSDPLGGCPFTEAKAPGEGIPVVVVDEEIYRRLPAMLIATVDKFAQLPWNGQTQMLFGRVDSRCPRHGYRTSETDDKDSHVGAPGVPATRTVPHGPLRPPDLIIQDELHLISGPLGSLVGLYETAVDGLCEWTLDGKTVRPKVVASTATIRRAASQVWSIFQRRVEVFPPHGTDVRDNFFARQRDPGRQPGRRYLGVCASGRRMKAVHIRVYTALLAAGQQLFERYGKHADAWMTVVGYFNSLRELGGMRRLVDDDVRARLRKGDEIGFSKRKRPRVEELTSRKGAGDIPKVLDLLEMEFDPARIAERDARRKREEKVEGADPLDVLLATNMISVGVDVKRLGLMVVAGQPKSTAEYIQATSRIGRSQPGLVFTVGNWARPRDLSHHERFEHYHATFYQHVEALSVTPFAARAVDRGLSALLVALVRLEGRELNPNTAAGTFAPGHVFVERAVARIAARAGIVTRRSDVEDEVRRLLQSRIDAWSARASRREGGRRLGYKSGHDEVTIGLLDLPGIGPWDAFTCLNSLRDVEPAVGLILSDFGMDRPAAPPPGAPA